MTEEKTTTTAASGEPAATLEGSAFARVLGRLLEARGIPADEGHALDLAERSGLDRETFRQRLFGTDVGAGNLTRLAKELSLSAHEMLVLALAYALEEERETEETSGAEPGGIPSPEEVVAHYEELPEKLRARPLRCRAGSKSENPCPREATTWMYPKYRDHPLCEEHARANELWMEASEVGVAEEITGDWIRIARAWRSGLLEDLAITAHEHAKEEALKAEARASLAVEIADAPRNADEQPNLTREEHEKIMRLIRRSDAFTNARTALEDHAAGEMDEKVLRLTLGILIEEGEKATEEAHDYKEELGLYVRGSEKP